MKPKVSVVIPVYNEERYLKKTLLSLRKQKTNVPYEIIVCDNNSKDSSVKIARRYADKVVFEKRQGIPFARNTGTRYSKAEYLVHTDADTIFPENFIEEVYKIFKSGKYAAFSCGVWDYYEGNSFATKLRTILWNIIQYTYMCIQNLTNRMALVGWCLCTPRTIFEKAGGFIEKKDYLEDLLFGFQVEYLGKYGYFPNIRVRSSTRRFEKGIINFIKHYEAFHAPIKVFIFNLFRKRFTKPYNYK